MPRVEKRTYRDFVADVERHLQRTAGWTPPAGGGDPGSALVHVFARMAEVVADRLNRVPDRNFLAFLDLIGTELLPPQPARVPLTFALAAGSPVDALVPARTPVGALPLEGETEPVAFETERELVVTRSRLAAAWVRDPLRDRRTDAGARATGAVELPFRVFEGEDPTDHRVCFGDREAFGEAGRAVTLFLGPGDPAVPWPEYAAWEYLDGAEWRPLPMPAVGLAGDDWGVSFADFPAVPEARLGGRASAWISARLPVALRERAVVAGWWHETAVAEDGVAPYPLSGRAWPFGERVPRGEFHLSAPEVFGTPGALVSLRVETDFGHPAVPAAGLTLAWEYFRRDAESDPGEWVALGRSTPEEEAAPGSDPDFADPTRALTLDGTVRFRVPSGWAESKVGGVVRRWLRVRVEAGGYGEDEDFRPPALLRARLDSHLPVAPLARVQATAQSHAVGAVPDALLAGGAVLDPGRDFLPFGDRPRVGDAFYFASRALADRPGAAVTLRIALTNPDPEDAAATPPAARPEGVVLAWEYWDRGTGRWETLGHSGTRESLPDPRVEDDSRGFSVHGEEAPHATVTFTLPPTMGATEVDGRVEPWIRVRLSGGGYGHDAGYAPAVDAEGKVIVYPGTSIPVYQMEPATFRPPSVRSLELDVSHGGTPRDVEAVVAENDSVRVDATAALADGGSFVPFVPAGGTEPALYLGFERPGSESGFDGRAVTLFFGVAEATYDDADPERDAPDGEPDVVWEYWNGRAWARLGARDETAGFTRRGTVTFVGPPDLRASTEFGRTAFWLRARLASGGHPVPPALRRVLTNTTWAVHGTEVRGETLGSGTGERGQRFRATRAPVLPGEQLEVREPELPSAEERARIEAEEGPDAVRAVPDATGRPVEVWVRWHRVPDFHGSGPRDRHYTLDRRTGEVRFGDGQRGMAPPVGRGSVRLARYHTGGGPQGNRPAGNVTQLRVAVPYVDAVTNPEPAGGGSAGETVAEATERGPRALRHRGRAVALADFEDLAREASPEVALARAVPPRGADEAGSVALVIVPRGADPRPVPSLELLERVRAPLAVRASPTVDVVVQGPEWVSVGVATQVVPAAAEAASQVHAAVLARLAAFLHPLTGGVDGRGWPFGRKPHRSDLYALLEGTPGVDHVRSLEVREGGAPQSDRFLVYAGAHEVTVAGPADL
jgi:hypothetical protein